MRAKRNIAIVLLIILIIIFGFLTSIFLKNLKSKNESQLTYQIQTIGETVYSDYYYRIISVDKTKEQVDTFLAKFEKMGLSFSLEELQKNSDDYRNTIDEYMKLNKNCQKSEIMVVIYPKSPYSKLDYTSEIRNECKAQ